jgi:hypothetical protein
MANSFGTYLKRQKDRDDFVGDLAQDFIDDCKFRKVHPSIYKTPDQLWEVASHRMCAEARRAFNEAAFEFQRLGKA